MKQKLIQVIENGVVLGAWVDGETAKLFKKIAKKQKKTKSTLLRELIDNYVTANKGNGG